MSDKISMRICLLLLSIFALYGCQEKLEEACAEANCGVTSASESVDITYYGLNEIALADTAYFEPVSFVTHNNNFSCSIPQSLIDAGFMISSECVIYGTPLKTLSGNFIVTILDFETAQDKSVLIAINVFDSGSGCGIYGRQVTITNYPTVGSLEFSFCVEDYEYISTKAAELGISLPGNGCLGTCTASLATLVSGTLVQNEGYMLTGPQIAADYVVYDVSYPTSDVTLNLSPDLQAFCLLSLVPCTP